MKPCAPKHIASIIPYPPGKPIEELEREYGISGSIKLASNENPLGPSPKAIEAVLATLSKLNRYPDGSGFYLRKKLSEKYCIPFDGIVLGNGSNEIIELVIRAFLTPGDEVIMPAPSFLLYRLVVQCRPTIWRTSTKPCLRLGCRGSATATATSALPSASTCRTRLLRF